MALFHARVHRILLAKNVNRIHASRIHAWIVACALPNLTINLPVHAQVILLEAHVKQILAYQIHAKTMGFVLP